ncbi:MAG: ATP-binding protein [Dehalococcoidales bacterium]|nr:ATP-binding protein [Dehalococcoidales bacterium]
MYLAVLRVPRGSWRCYLHVLSIAVIMAVLAYVFHAVLAADCDVFIIAFAVPLFHAAAVFRRYGVIACGLAFLAIVLPRAFLPSYDPEILVRVAVTALPLLLAAFLTAWLIDARAGKAKLARENATLKQELDEQAEKLKKTQQQLVQVAKLSSLGELTAGLAHELNNPLAGMLLYVRLIQEKLTRGSIDRAELGKALDEITTAIDYCTGIIHGLMDFARQTETRFRPITVSRAIDKAMLLVGHHPQMKTVEVVREEAPHLPLVVGDFNQLVQVLLDLILNALQAMGGTGRLTIRAAADGNWVKVSVSDTGCGISRENMDKIFTPFFTTKAAGTGLGLAIARGIIERHGGRIEVQSEPDRGSTFTVVLPAYREESLVSSTG